MNHQTDKGAEDLYTPALGYRWLTPFYDSALALLTREGTWRSLLIQEIDPKEDDRILDVGCGTGTLAVQMKIAEPAALIIGIDPDEVKARLSERYPVVLDGQNPVSVPATIAQKPSIAGFFSSVKCRF